MYFRAIDSKATVFAFLVHLNTHLSYNQQLIKNDFVIRLSRIFDTAVVSFFSCSLLTDFQAGMVKKNGSIRNLKYPKGNFPTL